jgi:hypothetical protein
LVTSGLELGTSTKRLPCCRKTIIANHYTKPSLNIKLLQVIIIIPIDRMFLFKMDRQTIDGWLFLVHGKFHDVPDSLSHQEYQNLKTLYR